MRHLGRVTMCLVEDVSPTDGDIRDIGARIFAVCVVAWSFLEPVRDVRVRACSVEGRQAQPNDGVVVAAREARTVSDAIQLAGEVLPGRFDIPLRGFGRSKQALSHWSSSTERITRTR